jgi:hypothetical protein
MDLAITAIKNAVSPFEQFHALLITRTLFDQATASQRRALLDALQIQEGTPIHESDPSRMLIKNDLLRRYSTMSILSVEVIRAGKGDCLILHYGTADNPRLALIDGGPKSSYAPYLRPRLQQIRDARNLSKSEPLPVDLLMISHVDNDHMHGFLDLTRELIEAQMTQQPPFVHVQSLWHNSFENIIGVPIKGVADVFDTEIGVGLLEGDRVAKPDLRTMSLSEKDISANLQVVTSIHQNAQLRTDARQLNLLVNGEFDGALIMAVAKGKPINFGSGLRFTVIGPLPAEVKQFQQKHQAWLKQSKSKDLMPTELFSLYLDTSILNLSSIVVLVEVNKKRILLTGDASGEAILQGLEFVGLVKKGRKIHVDVLKVPNHGSSEHLYYEFFERVTADHYVISGNGEHGYPDRDSFDMIMRAREGAKYTIHLTYPVPEIDANRKLDWEKQRVKELNKARTTTSIRARRDWSPAAQSLQALFDKNPELAIKIRVVEESRPHVINLLEEVAF